MSSEASERRQLSIERERSVFEVDVTRDVGHVRVVVGDPHGRDERTRLLLRAVADAGVPIFLAKLHGQEVSFATEARRLSEVEQVLAEQGFDYRMRRDLALVTVTSGGLPDRTVMMVRIADALHVAGARMYGVGDSHSSVQCLIDGEHAEAAAAQLRSALGAAATHA